MHDGLLLQHDIRNVVPGDFDHDGRQDLLVMYEHDEGWFHEKEGLSMAVYRGGGVEGGFRKSHKLLLN